MPGQVLANALFFPDIRVDFWENFKATETAVDGRLAAVMNLSVGSTKSQEAYGYSQAAPVGRYWQEGLSIPTDQMSTNLFFQRNWKFGVGVEISRVAVQDDQTKLIMSRVMEASASFAMLKERHFWWLFSGGGTYDAIQMQPQIPLAPDGVGWFSKTDGNGNQRFQITGGNIVTSQGVGSPQAIINNYFGALQQIAAFRNLQNQPVWNQQNVMRKSSLVFAVQNEQNFVTAINQMFIVAASGNSAPSNVLKDMGQIKDISLISNSRITTNNWAVICTDGVAKAPFWQEREAPIETLADLGNSDVSREFDVTKLYVRCRGAIGLNLPLQSCAVQ
jgi:hypothetical protein